MARPAPKYEPEWLTNLEKNTQTEQWQIYRCKLVTPMYGGGVKAGEVDAEIPIRASEIRGQLRFWWRLLNRNKYPTSKELFEKEREIWGGLGDEKTLAASKVRIRVVDVAGLKIEPCGEYVWSKDKEKFFLNWEKWAHPYALFSAQGKANEVEKPPSELAREGLSWGLQIGFQQLYKDDEARADLIGSVEEAFRWWATFGGVGARTRRGLGAICVVREGLKPVSMDEVIGKEGILKLDKATTDNPMVAWKSSIEKLSVFRQGLGFARNKPAENSKSPAGRSFWPEADTLRVLSQQSLPKHRKRLVNVNAFPRAAFGLPIVFKFKDEASRRDKQAKGYSWKIFDPDVHYLEPADISPKNKRDRMASPLILRPYWNGSTWQAAALLLPNWQNALKQKLKFKDKDKSYEPAHWPENPVDQLAKAKAIKPMQKPSGEIRATDPLSAFMDFFEKGV